MINTNEFNTWLKSKQDNLFDEGIEFYTVGDRLIHPQWSTSSYAAGHFVILMRIDGEVYFKYVISLPAYMHDHYARNEVSYSIDEFRKLLKEGKAATVDPDGGSFGLGDNLERVKARKKE